MISSHSLYTKKGLTWFSPVIYLISNLLYPYENFQKQNKLQIRWERLVCLHHHVAFSIKTCFIIMHGCIHMQWTYVNRYKCRYIYIYIYVLTVHLFCSIYPHCLSNRDGPISGGAWVWDHVCDLNYFPAVAASGTQRCKHSIQVKWTINLHKITRKYSPNVFNLFYEISPCLADCIHLVIWYFTYSVVI